jgi:hypothetical protein
MFLLDQPFLFTLFLFFVTLLVVEAGYRLSVQCARCIAVTAEPVAGFYAGVAAIRSAPPDDRGRSQFHRCDVSSSAICRRKKRIACWGC